MEARVPRPSPERSARLGAAVAGGGGVLLLAALFIPWYTLPGAGLSETPLGDIAEEVGGAVGFDVRDAISRTGWESFEFTDLVAALAAIIAIIRAGMALLGRDPDPPIPGSMLAVGLGTAAALMISYRIANPPGIGNEREIGVWLGFLGAIAIAYGSGIALRAGRLRGDPPRV